MSQGNQNANTPEELIKHEKRFRIPLYQRPYAWEKEQVEQLLNDLLAAHKNQPEEHYHLGLLSVAPSVDDGLLDLIDGQQRITTLILIGKVAAETRDHEGWNKFCTDDRLKLYGRRDDQDFLRTGSEVPGSTLNQNLKTARKCVEEFFNSTPEINTVEKRKAFSNFIFDHAAFFLG